MRQAPHPQIVSGPYGELLIAPDTNGKSAPHFHTTYAIGVNRTGTGTVFARGRSWPYSANMVVVTNPLEPHWGRASPDGVQYSLLYPELPWLRALPGLAHLPFLLHFEQAVLPDLGLAARLQAAFDLVLGDGDVSLLPAAVSELFCRYATLAPPASGEAPPLAPATGSIAGCASRAGLSRAYHSRKHRQLTGLSPLDHRRQARVLAARSLIEAGEALADAAADAGFADQAHMTRQFRQVLGVTPNAYRRRN